MTERSDVACRGDDDVKEGIVMYQERKRRILIGAMEIELDWRVLGSVWHLQELRRDDICMIRHGLERLMMDWRYQISAPCTLLCAARPNVDVWATILCADDEGEWQCFATNQRPAERTEPPLHLDPLTTGQTAYSALLRDLLRLSTVPVVRNPRRRWY